MVNNNIKFYPCFCPNPKCPNHRKPEQVKKWFVRHSYYFCEKENKQYQRYMCLECKKTFSERSFSLDYYLKLNLSYKQVFLPLKKKMSATIWAKALNRGVSVIENRLCRLGRWLLVKGYLSATQIRRARKRGLVEFGWLLRRLWFKVFNSVRQNSLKRCFLCQLALVIDIVDNVELWSLLSWRYCLSEKYFYRPAFTFS